MRTIAAGCLALLPLLGCVEQSGSRPSPERVEPSSAPQGQATAVAIVGQGFRPLVRANYDDEQKAVVSDRFMAWLGDHALQQVVYVNGSRLTAQVPGTLPAGTYDLSLTDPAGAPAELKAAFTVVPGEGEATTDGPRPDVGLPDVGLPDLPVPDLPVPDLVPVPDLPVGPDLLKPLGAPCNQHSECISNHCIDLPDQDKNEVCCIQACPEWKESGCSQDGTHCVND